MSFKIEQGLFKLDLTDHHAILGVPVDADPDQIRQRYKLVARLLHPDTCAAETPEEKEFAKQLFSKLVSPAYSELSKSRNRAEYLVLLGHVGKRLATEPATAQITSLAAKELAQAGANLDSLYKNLLRKLAAKQYDSFYQVIETIAQISELNMVFLMYKEGQGIKTITTAGSANYTVAKQTTQNIPVSGNKPAESPTSPVTPYLQRAEEYVSKNNLAKAILELRDALSLEPNNSTCHSLLGMIYLKQHQGTMAKVHINKALQLNPKDPKALQAKQLLDKFQQSVTGKTSQQSQSNQSKATNAKPSDNSGGGLFGGLFGGKKK
ncbi:heat shock protein DnaJ domain protein [Crinalium epipsammum PCC 9333]|uniref:Heat shock protein DnaJ domain protein n=1 Tax=Crinalium epipsammum PCC 9333 TaxID=1173022 RepID=K9W3A4_9CYAN|nr:J domain-containing protein [Crinalium epipsammum]AFZ14838.1 heat shock protein DnaJ domain protein [Crinalium epipsammum PCC 9333]